MALDKSIKRVLVIGSGPIVIGQAAEFDYAGTQACRMLKEDGIEIILVNSNPATIMTDNLMADKIYIEPLTLNTVKRIIEKERPDSILSGLGGQTGLTLCMQLAKEGFLDKMNVKLLGSSPETIDKAEDRQIFKDTMISIGEPVIPSTVSNNIEHALEFANENSYPLIIRPAFTLGGTGGGIAYNEEEFLEIANNGLLLSPIHQILVEKCISGWKEIEFEVMRDKKGNSIVVCSMENFDPVGVHTGDSIVIAPAVTLSDKEYQMLRSAAINIINALGVEGGCNCQFALHPHSFEYAVIEVNPRVSRSSALASKATGYPIAKVATKIALGYTLDEILNAVTGKTFAAFEPTLDYVAVKFPKWPFDKFVYAKKDLGTQMKATGEVMSIADSFEHAILKAVRGAEIGLETLTLSKFEELTVEELKEALNKVTDERLFLVYEALKRGITVDFIHLTTKIDRWFLSGLLRIANYEKKLSSVTLTDEVLLEGKELGFTDSSIEKISKQKIQNKISPVYKMVDTCAGEFEATTPYFYSIYASKESGGENEALEFINRSNKKKIVVLGSGPIRIGQGIEFDYACVHCVWSLKKEGYEVIVINNNPETVSTDFDTADRLYFEPLNIEDVMNIIEIEKPEGVIVAFGGGTAIKLTGKLHKNGVKIIGTSADSIDICEDRERFDELLETLDIKRPKGLTVTSKSEAIDAANTLGYPVLLRPSYVLGGQNMIIAFNDEDVNEYIEIIFRQEQDNPVLIDKYLTGREIEVDSICDGVDILIPGIMEHVERTGIHSGDSIAVYPPIHVDDRLEEKILDITRKICLSINVRGLVNIQYIVMNDEIYVIEVNPRASRTVPYLSKVTGIQMCELATRASIGHNIEEMGYSYGVAKIPPYVAVKVPVFSFEKLTNVDTQLGPEMKSTGEVLGIGINLKEALYKGLIAAGYKMNRSTGEQDTGEKNSGVFITVRNHDKAEIVEIAKKFFDLGFNLYSTKGTAKVLSKAGLLVTPLNKIHESKTDNTMTLLESKKVNYIISTSAKGRDPERDSVKIRRKAALLGIPCLTSIDTANALVDSLMSKYSEMNTELVDINNMRSEPLKINFIKMQGSSNDYIFIDCREEDVESPESLSVFLSDRHLGIGGTGIVLMCKSDVAVVKMRIFNLDGSEGEMCGNAIRCVAKYMYDNKFVTDRTFGIETLSGIKEVTVYTTKGIVTSVKVNMGKAVLDSKKIPVLWDKDVVINEDFTMDNVDYKITCVSMGNPHCVVFNEHIDSLVLDKLGPKFETNEIFPERANIEFVKVIGRHTIKMRVWERGNGETLACGTGACASVVAAVLNGYCNKNEDIRVILKGGDLIVNYTDDSVFLTGDCAKVFEGTVEI